MFLEEGLGSSGYDTELLWGFRCRGCCSCRGRHCKDKRLWVMWALIRLFLVQNFSIACVSSSVACRNSAILCGLTNDMWLSGQGVRRGLAIFLSLKKRWRQLASIASVSRTKFVFCQRELLVGLQQKGKEIFLLTSARN